MQVEAIEAACDEVKAATHQRLSTKFAINSEFVRVPLLSKVLGISSNAIYAQMRNGSFPIAHRRVGNVVVVKFPDLVDWYCQDTTKACARPDITSAARLQCRDEFTCAADDATADIDAVLIKHAETPTERAQRFKQEVIAGMKARQRQSTRP